MTITKKEGEKRLPKKSSTEEKMGRSTTLQVKEYNDENLTQTKKGKTETGETSA